MLLLRLASSPLILQCRIILTVLRRGKSTKLDRTLYYTIVAIPPGITEFCGLYVDIQQGEYFYVRRAVNEI